MREQARRKPPPNIPAFIILERARQKIHLPESHTSSAGGAPATPSQSLPAAVRHVLLGRSAPQVSVNQQTQTLGCSGVCLPPANTIKAPPSSAVRAMPVAEQPGRAGCVLLLLPQPKIPAAVPCTAWTQNQHARCSSLQREQLSNQLLEFEGQLKSPAGNVRSAHPAHCSAEIDCTSSLHNTAGSSPFGRCLVDPRALHVSRHDRQGRCDVPIHHR